MLFVRDVIRLPGKRLARYVGNRDGNAILLDLSSVRTQLEEIPLAELNSGVARGTIALVTDHVLNCRATANISKAQKDHAAKLYKIVVKLLAKGPIIFDLTARGHLIAKASVKYRVSATTIHRAINRFWKYGLTFDALLPAFDLRGGKGKVRRVGERPSGRPPPGNSLPAPVLTEQILSAFRKGTDRYYRKNWRNSLAEAYRLILKDLSTTCQFDPETAAPVTFVNLEPNEAPVPTLRQFRYWYKKQNRLKEDARARMPEPKFQAKHRAKLSYAAQDNENIGGRYVIDSTPLDLNLISRIDPDVFLGTPTLYFVIDELTALIVGFALSLEDASWTAAGLAMLNAVEDKVAFCAQFGIRISDEEWGVSNFVAMRLLFDKGEAKGTKAEEFGLKSSLTIENAASFRGDLKGICEQRFDLVNEALRGRVEGYRVKNSDERGEKDPRLNACLDVYDATCVIIRTILFLNHNEIPQFRRSRAMLADQVPPIPIEMWNWAMRTGRNALVRRGYPEMLIALLPTDEATVTDKGLRFKGLFYTCETAEHEKWFEYVTSSAHLRRMTISFHPWLVDVIYIHGERGEYEVAVLTQHSSRYAGISFEELVLLNGFERGRSRMRQHDQIRNHANFDNHVKQIVEQAQARRLGRLRPKDLAGAKLARAAEREFDREDHRNALIDQATDFARNTQMTQSHLPLPKPISSDDLGD